VSANERGELVRLRRENWVLRMERDLLSCAAAFFAEVTFALIDVGVGLVPDRVRVWASGVSRAAYCA
jgi:hypothetical protein